jgi:hypothetical protein
MPTFIANLVDNETPVGAVNGSNVTYTLAETPSPAASLRLHVNGLLNLAGGVDYTLSGKIITMTYAPWAGSRLRAWYRT